MHHRGRGENPAMLCGREPGTCDARLLRSPSAEQVADSDGRRGRDPEGEGDEQEHAQCQDGGVRIQGDGACAQTAHTSKDLRRGPRQGGSRTHRRLHALHCARQSLQSLRIWALG